MKGGRTPCSPQRTTQNRLAALVFSAIIVLSSMVAGVQLVEATTAGNAYQGFETLTVDQQNGKGDVRNAVVDWTVAADASVEKLVIEIEDGTNQTISTSIGTNPKTIVDPGDSGSTTLSFLQKDINSGTWIRVTQILSDGSVHECVGDYASEPLALGDFSCTTDSESNEPEHLTTSDGTTSFTENEGPVVIDENLTVNGSSFDSFIGAAVSIDSGFDRGADVIDYDATVVPLDSDGTPIITGEYNQTTGVLSFNGTAGIETYQNLLRTVTYDTSKQPPTTTDRIITFTLTAADQSERDVFYNPATDHYYEYVTSPGIEWSEAKTAAESKSYAGLSGYLVTVTSEAENDLLLDRVGKAGWIGASDATDEGNWRWVTGPEGSEASGAGRHFFTEDAAHVAYTDPYDPPPAGVPGGGTVVDGEYANWHPRHEPDNKFPFFGGEDYAYMCGGPGRCSDGMWQDAAASSPNFDPKGYYVEYGGQGVTPEMSFTNITATKTVTVTTATLDTTPPTANAGPDQTVNPGDPVALDASASTDGETTISRYEWDVTGNGRTDLTGVTNTTSFGNASNYTVTLTVTDEGGNTASDTMTVEVTDTNAPTAVITAPDSAARGEAIDFTGTNSTDDIAIVSFDWAFGDGTPNSTEVSPVHGYDTTGTYTVTLTVRDLAGNTDTTTHSVDITASTRPVVSNVTATNPDSANLTVSLDSDQLLDTITIGVYDTDQLTPGPDDADALQYTITKNDTVDHFGSPTTAVGKYTYTNTTTVTSGNYTIRVETAANDVTGDGGTGQTATVTISNVGPAGMAGDGSLETPYVITNVTQLQAMSEELDAHYVLGNDIEANETSGWNGGAGFTPVGDCPDSHSSTWGDCSGGTPFTGSLDGQSYAITNLTIDRPSGTGVGLFGLADDASFRNIRLVDVNVTGEENVGGLVGHMQGSGASYPHGEVENVSVSGDVTWSGTGNGNAGGKFGGIVGLASNAKLVNKNVFRGNVTGKFNVGGLVGRMAYDTTIGTSYAQGSVTSTAADDSECSTGNGQCEAGGLAGNSGNPSSITNAYAAVEVTAPTAGAIIGMDNGADTLTNVYWDADVGPADASSGSIDDAGSGEYTGLTTSQMQGDTAPDHMNFDWNDTWQTVPGDYPVFQWEANAMDPVTITGTITNALDGASLAGATVNSTVDSTTTDGSGTYTLNVSALGDAVTATATVDEGFTITKNTVVSNPNDVDSLDLALGPTYNGSGTQADPYQVATLEDLQQIRYDLGAEYVLTDDIDATATANWFGGGGFSPLGNGGNQFTGVFDGAGYTVTGLTIDRDGTVHVGLFGYLHSSATVESVTLHDVDITGDEYVGGIVGVNDGTIRNVSTTGDVHAATWRAGGLVGRNIASGSVTRSFSTARISSPDQLGGLIGRNHGTVTDSYATGDVVGGAAAGGLIGADTGTTTTSYSTGAVSGSGGNVGGLIGNEGAGVSSSYWDVEQSTQQTSSAGTGLTTDQMTGIAAETNMSGFDFSSPWVSTDSYPVLAWQVAGLQLGIDASAINQTDSTNATVTLALHDGSTVTATGPASYATNNSSVATTSAGGRIVGAGVGTANITASHGGYTAVAPLVVTEGDVTAPGISNFDVSNPSGQTIEVTLDSNETLDTIEVSITNAVSRTLSRGDFSEAQISGGHRYVASFNDSTDGTYEATLDTAADAAGNDGAGSESDSVSVDTTAPSVSTYSVTNPSDQMVTVTVATDEQLATISVSGTDDAVGTTLSGIGDGGDFTESSDDGTFTYTATLSDESDGTFGATLAVAMDPAGNDGADGQFAFVDVDTTAPVPTIHAPTDGTITGSTSIELTVSANEPGVSWNYSLDDGTGHPFTPNTTLNGLTNGSHTVTVFATDTAGNVGTTSATFSVDTDAPAIQLGAPSAAVYNTTTLPLTVSTDEANVSWTYRLDGGTNVSFTPNTTLADLSEGSHTLTIFATDVGGNTAEHTVTFTIDTGAPSPSIHAPIADATVGTTTVDLDVSANESVTWSYSLDGGTTTTAFTPNTTLSGLTDQQYSLTVYATDDAGNTGATSVSFTVDTTPPTVSNSSVTNPAGQNVTISFDATEALVTVTATVSGAETTTLTTAAFTETDNGDGTYTYTATHIGSTDGTYTVTLTGAEDTAGNDAATGQGASVSVDTTAPTISGFDTTTHEGQNVTLSFNTTEQLDAVAISLSGAESTTLSLGDFSETANGDGTHTYTTTYEGNTDGTYTATLTTATDEAGNDGASNQTASVTVNTEPVVASASASSYYVDVGTSVTLRGTDSSVPAGATATYEWDLDGDGTTDATGETVSYSFSTPGTHDVTLTVTVGAESDTDAIAITTVDTTSPTVDLGPDREVAEGTTESFDVSGSSSDNVAITDYEWDFDGDGTTDTTGSSATYTFDDPGTYVATITVTDAAGNTGTDSLRVHVIGPEASVSTTSLDFGETATGSSTTHTVAITNTGTTILNVTGATITGTNQIEFAITGSTTPPLLVKPGQTRSIRVAYSPTATGPASATLTLATNDTDLTSPTIALSGAGVTGDLTGNASTLDYGTVDVGTTATKRVTLTNQGGAAVDVTAVSITGVDVDQFTITDAAGLPTTIASGDTRTLTIEYAPTRTGDQVATLAVETADGPTHTTSLVGEAAGPDISLPAGNLSFEAIGVDNASTETLTVANHGDRDLTIGDITLTGPNADQFTIEHSPGTISAGSSAPISLNFSPDTAGTHLATLEIESDDPDEPTATHQIVGTAVAPKIGVDNRTLDFGNVSVNETVTMNITVRNLATSKGPLTVDQTHLTGRNPGDFNVTAGGAPFTLAPGESRRLELSFTPLTAGLKEAQLQIISNSGNDPQIDVWLSNSRTYLVVQSIAPDDSTSPKRTVNVDANRVAPNGSLSVNVSRPETRLEDVSFDRLNMTVTPGGDFTMNLSHGDAPSDGAVVNFSSSTTKPVKYVTLTHSLPNADYANTSVAFRVKDSALHSSIDPADVQFHRYSNGTWNAIETTLLRSTGPYHYYAVETPGFSEFVITQPTATSGSTSPPPSQTGTATLAFAATSSVSFGDQFVGTTTTREVTIENTGTASTDIDAVAITGPAGGLYTIIDSPTRLGPGESATITVAFTPDRIGQLDATLSLTDEDGTRTSLALTGVSKATVTASNESLSFGNVSVGQSVTKWITISVPAGAPNPVVITSADLVGGDLHDYDVSETQTPFTILPGESRRIAVTHTPSSPGQKTATLRIRTDTPASAQIDIAVSNLDSAIIVRPLTDTDPIVNIRGIRIDADEFLDLNTTTPQTMATDIFVEHLEFTPLREGNFTMNLTHSDSAIGTAWPDFPDDSRAVLKYIELTHTITNADLSDTAVRFRVEKSRLTSIGATPSEVVFYRYDGSTWEAMPTTLVGESNTAYHYRSETPGFSRFLVTSPRSHVHVVDGTLSATTLTVGESITLTASVWNNRSTTTSTTLSLVQNDTTIDTTSLTLAANETRTVSFTRSFTQPGTFRLTVNDYYVGTVRVEPDDSVPPDHSDPATTSDATDRGEPTTTSGATDASGSTPDGESDSVDDAATDEHDPESGVLGMDSPTVSWLLLVLAGLFVLILLLWRRRDDEDEADDHPQERR